jgi:hypothetical protein
MAASARINAISRGIMNTVVQDWYEALDEVCILAIDTILCTDTCSDHRYLLRSPAAASR